MKHLSFLLFALIGFTVVSSAQSNQKGQMSAVIKTPTVQCEQCKKRIENYMSHEEAS